MANGASSAYLLSLLRSQGGYADASARSLLGRDVTTERQSLAEKNREIEKAIRDRERAAKKKRRRRGRAGALASIAGYALGGAGGAALGSLLGSRLSRARQGDIKSIGTEIGEGKFLKGDREDLVNFLEDANYQISQQNKKGLGWQEDLMAAAQAYGTGKAFGGTEFGQKMGTFRGWDLGSKIQQSKMMSSPLANKIKGWWNPESQKGITNITPQTRLNFKLDTDSWAKIPGLPGMKGKLNLDDSLINFMGKAQTAFNPAYLGQSEIFSRSLFPFMPEAGKLGSVNLQNFILDKQREFSRWD